MSAPSSHILHLFSTPHIYRLVCVYHHPYFRADRPQYQTPTIIQSKKKSIQIFSDGPRFKLYSEDYDLPTCSKTLISASESSMRPNCRGRISVCAMSSAVLMLGCVRGYPGFKCQGPVQLQVFGSDYHRPRFDHDQFSDDNPFEGDFLEYGDVPMLCIHKVTPLSSLAFIWCECPRL